MEIASDNGPNRRRCRCAIYIVREGKRDLAANLCAWVGTFSAGRIIGQTSDAEWCSV